MKSVPVSPSNGRLRIGARLRAARQRQGLTIDQVAASAEVTKGFISRIERDETSPSVATLVTICEVLSLPIGTLFEAPQTDVVRKADAPSIHLTGAGAEERLLTPRGQARLQLIRSVIEPGGTGGGELYTLNCEIEVLHVLKGTIDLLFSNNTQRLGAGDTITFSGREPHSWVNPDKTRTAEVMWVIAPASWDTSA
ncbi:helix-turn-helix domain-containing protein [Planosporangium mesophilum]|uniref:Transcription regulator n=1 Tax=Planosporangium mesophilum TaxID=689768 RepID=A0A8J3TDJ4_9ACTN|nr:helix-turn-helix domain-containing protein [Planosporangium mesophilum]NJC84574.1 helix-turn-helix domain-containing protein [Planosporangium mesophilum]GII23882.1 transcription regulator [Planosporangium mesophilum]